MRTILVASLVLVGCAASTDVPDDSEAVDAPPQLAGKADAPQFLGIYASHTTHHYNGDIPDLELRGDGHFIRERCYRSNCSLMAPETDAFDQYTSASGHTYVRFYGQQISLDSDGNIQNESAVADVYEIRAFTKGVQLRKAYSTRWQSLYLSSPSLACATSGGTYSGSDCTCPLNQPNVWQVQVFVPGAGGCIATPGASEDNCDTSHGMWADDDGTVIGSYCICSIGQYLDATGACAAI